MMGLSLRPSIEMESFSFIPLCRIVNLLSRAITNEGEIDGNAVKDAIADFYGKHSGESLADRVGEVYQPNLSSPGRATAYWTRSVNPNAIKVASLCLEKEVSAEEPDALSAALRVISNTLELYQNTKSMLSQNQENVRNRKAFEKAQGLYRLMKDSLERNKDYLERATTRTDYPGYSIFPIQQILNEIEKSENLE